jgi:hypothetical protein
MHRIRAVVLTFALVASLIAVAAFAGSARADYGPLAQYQIAISQNCNNPSFCFDPITGQPSLGGFWGWAVFNSDGTADAELTGCGHLPGYGGGAGHFHADAQWFIGSNRDFWTYNETDTFVGRGGTQVVTNPAPSDTGIPAAPGHYSTSDILGFIAPPGVSFQIQVTKIPNR